MSSIRKLWPELRPYKWQLLLMAVFAIILSAANGALPWAFKAFIDALTKKDAHLIYILPFVFPAIYLIAGISRYIHLFLIRYIGEKVTVNLRERLLDQYLRLNLTFHNSYESGSGGLMSRTLNDVNVLQSGIGILAAVVREPFTAAGLMFYLIYTDWKLTLFVLGTIPFVIIVLRQASRSLRKYGHFNQREMEETTSVLKESLDGVRVIQSFNLEPEMKRRFHGIVSAYLQTRKKIISREELSSPINDFIASLGGVCLCLYVGHQILGGEVSLGAFMGFVVALGLLQKPVKAIQDSYVRIQQGLVAVQRLAQILEDKNFVPQAKHPKPFPKNWQTIRYEHVSFRYKNEPVLSDVNITIHRGEVVALVGESGSGKSTLVNLLERFFDPTEGQIFIDDIPIQQIDLRDLRANIALVTQDVFLFRDSIFNNIHAGDFSKNPDFVINAARAANAEGFINRLPEVYQTNVGERGSLLSGGERQRVSIARAILKDAPLLILDEATSALDSASEVEVQKGIDSLMRGRTALVIAHRLSTVTAADRILVIKQGRIVEQGPHKDLIALSGEYHRFYELQVR